jgi:DNA repair exonuclease SbcCD ATPase subunit
VPVILATGLFVILVIAAIVYILPFADMVRLLFVLFTAVFVFITIIQGFKLKGYFGGETDALPDEEEFKRVLEELQAEAEQEEDIEIDMTFAKEFQEKKNELTNELNAQIERRNQRNKLRVEFDNVFKKKSELEAEMKAIDYAISKINSLSNDFRKEAFNKLLGNISTYVKKLTLDRFNRLSFDERGNCILVNDEGVLPITALTDEDAAIVYLAVRLSIAKFLSKEKMPLIIDGTSALTTAAEVKAFADCLVDMNEEQIILLTADMGMYSVFMSKGINVNRVAL